MEVQELKKQCRSELRQKLRALEAAYVQASDKGIFEKLVQMPQWKNARTVFMYVSMGNEPDTRRLLQEALAAGKRVCVPRCQSGGMMDVQCIDGMHQLAPAAFGLLEPDESAVTVAPQELDLVIAPCVAADRACRRLGNGGGYYDRYLPQVHCPVVCLCRQQLLQNSLPVEDCDAPVDMVLTDEVLLQSGAQEELV